LRGAAVVVFDLTSDPPCFSVIPIPIRVPDFSGLGRNEGSYERRRIRGIHSFAIDGVALSVGTTAVVIDIGQK
jgi:hypothetical protein